MQHTAISDYILPIWNSSDSHREMKRKVSAGTLVFILSEVVRILFRNVITGNISRPVSARFKKNPYVKLSISLPWPMSKKGSRAATFQSPEQGATGRHSSPNMLFFKKKKQKPKTNQHKNKTKKPTNQKKHHTWVCL